MPHTILPGRRGTWVAGCALFCCSLAFASGCNRVASSEYHEYSGDKQSATAETKQVDVTPNDSKPSPTPDPAKSEPNKNANAAPSPVASNDSAKESNTKVATTTPAAPAHFSSPPTAIVAPVLAKKPAAAGAATPQVGNPAN